MVCYNEAYLSKRRRRWMRIGICEDEQIIREQLTMLIKAYPTDEPIEVAAYVTGEDLLADTKGFDLSLIHI